MSPENQWHRSAHLASPGRDAAANDWILQAQKAKTPEGIAAVLKEFDGYYVVRLVDCDGVPKYANAGLYEGADDTSFRGAFLSDCGDVLSRELLSDAWNHKLPDEAVAYGRSLLTAADTAEAEGRRATRRRRGILSFMGLAKVREPIPIAEQLEIVGAAGRWFIFWGERGDPKDLLTAMKECQAQNPGSIIFRAHGSRKHTLVLLGDDILLRPLNLQRSKS